MNRTRRGLRVAALLTRAKVPGINLFPAHALIIQKSASENQPFRILLHVFMVVLFACGSSVYAQQAPTRTQGNAIPREFYPQGLRPKFRLSPEQQQTIDRALEDLQSDNVEFRAGAVMLLGKYEVPLAQDTVIQSLKDPHERVRRAALVSVIEWSRKAPVSAVEPVLSLLDDPDVEIRRMASSSLQMMLNIRQMARMSSFGRKRLQPFSPETKQALVDAFLDEDAVVRRNMVSQYSKSVFSVPPETFLKLLSDSDRQVRITALPLASSYADPESFLKAASHLVNDEDKGIRLLLIRQIFKHSHPMSLELLQTLLNDSEIEVAAEAELWLFQMNNEPELFERIYKRYQQKQLSSDQSTRMIQLAAVLGDKLRPYIYELIETDDSAVKLEAIRLFLEFPWEEKHEPYFVQFINDPSKNVRRVCMDYFRYNQEQLNTALLEEFVYSNHVDVRNFLVQLSGTLGEEDKQFVIDELILDEDPKIRVAAINKMAQSEIKGWEKVLAASLKDPNTEIQKTAVMQLIRNRKPKAKTILNEYMTEHPKSPLSAYIRNAMKQRNNFQAL